MSSLRSKVAFLIVSAFLLGGAAAPASAETLLTTQTPAKNGTHRAQSHEKGLAFYSVTAGQITAVRFWKPSNDTGTHVGRIWSNGGTLLASVTFTGETASGWQQQSLAAPLSIAANTTYIVSVNTTNRTYVYTINELDSQISNGSLRSVVGNNGRYSTNGGRFPSNGTSGTNFFRDVVFVSCPVSSLTINPSSLTGVRRGDDDDDDRRRGRHRGRRDGERLGGQTGCGGSDGSGTNSPALSTITVNPTAVTGGGSTTGTVTLTSPAPIGGAMVTLSSNNAAAAVPTNVTVPAGATSRTFTVITDAVPATVSAGISGDYNGSGSATLTVNSPLLSAITLNPPSVTGGISTTGTAILDGPAPAGGAVVSLSGMSPSVQGIQGVHSPADLPRNGIVNWANVGPVYSSVPAIPLAIEGMPGSTVTMANTIGLPIILSNCATGGSCSWYGNFAPGASILWVGGTYNSANSTWSANGPMTITFNSPQHGLGFQIMADETGPFAATLCAHNSSDTLLGCIPFSGNGTGAADGSAIYVGLYDDVAEIARITVDAGGALYAHDFAIGEMYVANTRRPMVPATVTVPAGASGATFPVSTSAVPTNTIVNITGVYGLSQSAGLTIIPPVLSTVSVDPNSVTGGRASTGSAMLTGPAPVGGSVVTLSGSNPAFNGIQAVRAKAELPQGGSIDWTAPGPLFSLVSSGATMPVAALSGITATISTATGQPAITLDNCGGGSCSFYGNFAQNARLLWVGGSYNSAGAWAANGPMTIAFNTPQRGVGFQIMADELGPFNATVCAYSSTNALLACVPYTGTGSNAADNSAIFVGLYDDDAEITRITIDAGGALYPHDFAIGSLYVTGAQRPLVPDTVLVPAGATSATFDVTTNSVTGATSATITGTYGDSQTTTIAINP